MERYVRDTWDNLYENKIQAMVARMAATNTLIIEHEGRNEFYG